MSRSGYKGKHGSFTVPADDLSRMLGLYLQVTVGDAPTTKPSVNETAYKSWISVKGEASNFSINTLKLVEVVLAKTHNVSSLSNRISC
jgi:acyl-CoA-binding protein